MVAFGRMDRKPRARSSGSLLGPGADLRTWSAGGSIVTISWNAEEVRWSEERTCRDLPRASHQGTVTPTWPDLIRARAVSSRFQPRGGCLRARSLGSTRTDRRRRPDPHHPLVRAATGCASL